LEKQRKSEDLMEGIQDVGAKVGQKWKEETLSGHRSIVGIPSYLSRQRHCAEKNDFIR
jgi:hypothetical protein